MNYISNHYAQYAYETYRTYPGSAPLPPWETLSEGEKWRWYNVAEKCIACWQACVKSSGRYQWRVEHLLPDSVQTLPDTLVGGDTEKDKGCP